MPTSIQRSEDAGTIAATLGQLPPDTTPAQRATYGTTLTDDQINANADRLLALLGYEPPAAA
jgi:hypothetical protein